MFSQWLSRQVTKLLWKKLLFDSGQLSAVAVLTTNIRKGVTLPSISNFRHLKLIVQCFLETPSWTFDSAIKHAACSVWTVNKGWLPTAPSWKRFLYSLTQQHCHGGAQKGIWEFFFFFFCIVASKHQIYLIYYPPEIIVIMQLCKWGLAITLSICSGFEANTY